MNVTGILNTANSAASAINTYLMQIATGKKSLAANPAEYVMGANFEAQVSQKNASLKNLYNEQAQINVSAGGAQITSSKLSQMGELAVQAQNGTLNAADKSALQAQFNEIASSISNSSELGLTGLDISQDPAAAQAAVTNAAQQTASSQVQSGASYNTKQFQIYGYQNEIENTMKAQSNAIDANLAAATAGLKKSELSQLVSYSMLKKTQTLMGKNLNLLI